MNEWVRDYNRIIKHRSEIIHLKLYVKTEKKKIRKKQRYFHVQNNNNTE